MPRYRIVVCRGPECGDRRDSAAIHARFTQVLAAKSADAELSWQSCFGRCRQGPNVLVRRIAPNESKLFFALVPAGAGANAALYNGVKTTDCERIVDEHVIGGRIVRDLQRRPEAEGDMIPPTMAGEPKDPK